MTAKGTLVTRDLGVLAADKAAFTEIERPESGAGAFSNPESNVFYISGSVLGNEQGFQGNLTGVVCTNGN